MNVHAASEMELGNELPTALYRLHATDDRLLYIGITDNLRRRFREHAADKSWWPEVSRRTVAWYASRAAAESAEDAAIKAERPAHNITGTAMFSVPATSVGLDPDLASAVATLISAQMDPSEMRFRIGQVLWPELSARGVADRLRLSRATRYRLQGRIPA